MEHKYVRQRDPSDSEFPPSSLLPRACLKVDLSLVDARSYGRAWAAPYLDLIDDPEVRARLVAQLGELGCPHEGLPSAVDRAASLIAERFASALSYEYPHPGDVPPSASVVQRLGLSALALDAELTAFIERGEATFERERARDPEVARWQVPESCIDLLVVALAWFYEQERDAYIWHLDELLRQALGPSCARFGAALRA